MKKIEYREKMDKAVDLILKADIILKECGFENTSQAGLLKEIMMAGILGHIVITDKHLPDAYNPLNEEEKYEYLSCQKNKTFAIDGMFSRPEIDKKQSLKRITRNESFYCGIFEGFIPLEIWRVETEDFFKKTDEDLTRRNCKSAKNKNSKGLNINREHTMNYSIKWVKSVGKKIWKK